MTALATDNFTRANSTGMSNASWTTASGANASANIVSNEAACISGDICSNYYSGFVWQNAQYVKCVIGSVVETVTDNGAGPMARMATGAQTGYLVQGNTHETRLYKAIAGAFTQLGSDGPAVTTGDVLEIDANGTSLTVFKNGTAICGTPVTDSSITSGNAGFWLSSPGQQISIDNWDAGDFNVAVTVQYEEAANRPRPGRGPFSKGRFYVSDYTAFQTPPQTYNLSITEAGSASDAVTALEVAVNSITEAGTAAAAVTAASIFGQAITEAGTAADALTALLVAINALTEAGSAADTSAGGVNALNTLTESGSAADAVSQGGSVFSQSVTESGTAADSVAAAISAQNSITESGSAAAAAANATTAGNSVTESGSAGDAVSQGGSVFSQAVTEAATAADALANFNTIVSALVESGTAVDALSVTSGGATSVTESLNAAMAVSHLATLLNSIAELGTANDALLVNGNYQAFINEAANAQDAVITVAPFLVGSPRYIIKRIRARRWTVSCNTYAFFESKAPDESVKLTFDFSPDLPAGVTLSGSPTVTFTVYSGADANPSAIANGLALPNEADTAIIVPVDTGMDGVTYKIHVLIATTDPQLILSLTGFLPVIA